jgi:hypothetical protein
MSYGNISATLSPLDKATILADILGISTKLPFLINLQPDERHDLRKTGTKREGLVVGTYSLTMNNQSSIPSSFALGEWTKDELVTIELKDIRNALATVVEGIDDTILALGVERLDQAETCLGFLETAAKSNSALNDAVKALKQIYAITRVTVPVITVTAGGSTHLEKVVVGRLFINKGTTVLAVNKAGSTNPATLINVDPNSSFKITDDYKNIDIVNLSPSQVGAFAARTQ